MFTANVTHGHPGRAPACVWSKRDAQQRADDPAGEDGRQFASVLRHGRHAIGVSGCYVRPRRDGARAPWMPRRRPCGRSPRHSWSAAAPPRDSLNGRAPSDPRSARRNSAVSSLWRWKPSARSNMCVTNNTLTPVSSSARHDLRGRSASPRARWWMRRTRCTAGRSSGVRWSRSSLIRASSSSSLPLSIVCVLFALEVSEHAVAHVRLRNDSAPHEHPALRHQLRQADAAQERRLAALVGAGDHHQRLAVGVDVVADDPLPWSGAGTRRRGPGPTARARRGQPARETSSALHARRAAREVQAADVERRARCGAC